MESSRLLHVGGLDSVYRHHIMRTELRGDLMALLIVIWVVVAVLCAVIASNKGRSAVGWFLLGAIFGIFALLIIAVIGRADQAPSSLTAQLAELERLRARRAISEAEYQQKKSSLLA